jgi:RHS repeat-associated protein
MEIGLGAKLLDGQWHLLTIRYTNSYTDGLGTHRACGQGGTYHGLTLYLGCSIEIRDSDVSTPRLSTGGKFQRVNLYGVPVAERTPTGEAESDQPKDGFYIDVYNLAPTASFADVSIPCEGGELALEFRRDGGVRTAQASISTQKLPITYPTDDLMGLGWNSNLCARAIISRGNVPCSEEPSRVSITDSGGTTYQYFLESNNQFRPEIYDSQGTASLSATPAFVGSGSSLRLVLILKHGTKYTYKKVGTFYQNNNNLAASEEYWRIESVEDRNHNIISYDYNLTGFDYYPLIRDMLVSNIREVLHPERQLTFTYSDHNAAVNQNGYDWGIRLTKVTDPLNRAIDYVYEEKIFNHTPPLPEFSRKRYLLTSVKYPQVKVDATETLDRPVQHYDYELRVTPGGKIKNSIDGSGLSAPYARLAHAGIKQAWQRWNNSPDTSPRTTFAYRYAGGELQFPVAVHPFKVNNSSDYYIFVEEQPVLTLESVTTVDGSTTAFTTYRSVACAGACSTAPFSALTTVTDPRSEIIEYSWEGIARPFAAPNDPPDPVTPGKFVYANRMNFGIVLLSLQRTTKQFGAPFATVRYDYEDNLFGNLSLVTDVSGNEIAYDYSTLAAQLSNQPTAKVVAGSLTTLYGYGVYNKLATIIDPENKVTEFSLDSATGNRTAIINESIGLGNRTTAFTYESDGFIEKTTDAENRETEFNRIFSVTEPLNYYTVESVVDPAGLNLKTVKIYDFVGNLRKEIPPEGFVSGHVPEDYATKYTYDPMNRITKVEKPSVNYEGSEAPTVEESFYDLRGNLIRKTITRSPSMGDVVTTDYEYDWMNRLTKTTIHPTPTSEIVTEKEYNEVGLVLREKDGRGNIVEFHYDTLLRLWYKEFAVSGQPLYEEYQYEYDGARQNSGSGAFSYNSGWKPLRVIDPRGFATDSKYDQFYRLVQAVRRRDGGLGISPAIPGRNEVGGASPQPAEPQTTTTYNAVGKVLKTEVALTNSGAPQLQTTYTFYDDFDRPTAIVLDLDGDGNNGAAYTPETLTVNTWSQLSADVHDSVTFTEYDKTDNVTVGKDPNGNQAWRYYDTAGRLEREVGEQESVLVGTQLVTLYPTIKTSYNANGAITAKQGPYDYYSTPGGRLTCTYYDKQGRPEKTIVDLDGNGQCDEASDIVTSIKYDLVGNIVGEIDAKGNETFYDYDGINRKIASFAPEVLDAETNLLLTPGTTFIYDNNANIKATIDPRGIRTSYEYDELNRVIVERKADNNITVEPPTDATELKTEKVYDENGNIIELRVHNFINQQAYPQQTLYTVDAFDRLVREELPAIASPPSAAQVKTYNYYRDGKLKSVIDAKGQEVIYEYDLARRMTQSIHKASSGAIEETREYVYDKIGNVTQVTDASGVTRYTLDHLYRIRQEERRIGVNDPPLHIVVSEYNIDGQRARVTYPTSGRVLSQAYDSAGRLASVYDSLAGITTTYKYDKNGNLTRMRWPTDSDTTFTLEVANEYDALNRLTSRVATRRIDEAIVYAASPYKYDLAGNLRSLAESINGQTRSITYDYDSHYRLASESWSGNTFSYSYDTIGNRRSKAFNRQGPSGTLIDTYTYGYNQRNELTTINFTPASGTGTPSATTFQYDTNGNRTNKSVDGNVEAIYGWDVSNRLKTVWNGQAALVFQATYDYRTRRITATDSGSTSYYVHDGGLCIQERPSASGAPSVELINSAGLGGGIGGLLYEVRNGARSHFVYNQVGHNVVQTNTVGGVTAWNSYEAFGNRLSFSAAANDRLANTKEFDASTQLYNHGFRYYDPVTGRYISRDPLGYNAGPNLYTYVNNNPVTRVDPLGLIEREALHQQHASLLGQAAAIRATVAAGGDASSTYKAYMAGQAQLARDSSTFLSEQWWTSSADVAAAGLHLGLPTTFEGVDRSGASAEIADLSSAGGEFSGQIENTVSKLETAVVVAEVVEKGGTVVQLASGAGAAVAVLKEAVKQGGMKGVQYVVQTAVRRVVEDQVVGAVEEELGVPVTAIYRGVRRATNDLGRGVRDRGPRLGQKQGREFRPDQLELNEFDPKQPAHVRGWLKNERRRVEQGRASAPRTPPGYQQAHGRTTPAREGYDYSNSRLQGADLNQLEESVRRESGK